MPVWRIVMAALGVVLAWWGQSALAGGPHEDHALIYLVLSVGCIVSAFVPTDAVGRVFSLLSCESEDDD